MLLLNNYKKIEEVRGIESAYNPLASLRVFARQEMQARGRFLLPCTAITVEDSAIAEHPVGLSHIACVLLLRASV